MIAPRCQQPNAQLRRLLDGQLPETVALDVTRHVEDCETCRQQLETMAADAQWWQEAQQFLSSDDNEPAVDDVLPMTDLERESAVEPFELVRGFLEPPADSSMLGRLEDYDILEVIGYGGMGIVFRGYDAQLDRFVAVKVLAPHYATSAAARKRFAREAQAAAAVVHPHVLAIHGVNGNSRLPYLVMPFVAGPSLQQRIDAIGPLEVKDVLRIGMQAAQGLAAAHAQGLVHRDIKPGNILLENGVERVLLTDFGLARAIDDASLTRSGVIAGTPQYMSPEQARGDAVDHRTDLFSLGSVLYSMCAGRPPFRAETALGVMRRICDYAPRDLCEVNSDVPRWLDDITARLLMKDRRDRFQSAEQVARILGQFLAHLQHPTSVPLPQFEGPVRTAEGPEPRSQRRLWSVVVAGCCVVVMVGMMLWPSLFPATPMTKKETGDSRQTETQATDSVPARVAPATPTDVLWDDGLDQDLHQISYGLRQLDNEEGF